MRYLKKILLAEAYLERASTACLTHLLENHSRCRLAAPRGEGVQCQAEQRRRGRPLRAGRAWCVGLAFGGGRLYIWLARRALAGLKPGCKIYVVLLDCRRLDGRLWLGRRLAVNGGGSVGADSAGPAPRRRRRPRLAGRTRSRGARRPWSPPGRGWWWRAVACSARAGVGSSAAQGAWTRRAAALAGAGMWPAPVARRCRAGRVALAGVAGPRSALLGRPVAPRRSQRLPPPVAAVLRGRARAQPWWWRRRRCGGRRLLGRWRRQDCRRRGRRRGRASAGMSDGTGGLGGRPQVGRARAGAPGVTVLQPRPGRPPSRLRAGRAAGLCRSGPGGRAAKSSAGRDILRSGPRHRAALPSRAGLRLRRRTCEHDQRAGAVLGPLDIAGRDPGLRVRASRLHGPDALARRRGVVRRAGRRRHRRASSCSISTRPKRERKRSAAFPMRSAIRTQGAGTARRWSAPSAASAAGCRFKDASYGGHAPEATVRRDGGWLGPGPAALRRPTRRLAR